MRLAMWVDREALEVTAGTPALIEFDRGGGRRRRAMACARCDTRLWALPEDRPGIAVLMPGTLVQGDAFEPVAHLWVRSALPWVRIPDTCARFDTQPDDPRELPRLWRQATRQAAAHDEAERSLLALVGADAALMAQLRAARALGLATWCIGAGAIRRRVWDARFGSGSAAHAAASAAADADVDVVYHDDEPWSPERDAALAARLAQSLPGIAWEVVHQGHVHAWSSARTGRELAPFESLEAAIASWPETATAVGVTLREDDVLEVVAPLGLADLMGGILRRNPRCPDTRAFEERLAAKRWLDRWPGLRVASGPEAPRSGEG